MLIQILPACLVFSGQYRVDNRQILLVLLYAQYQLYQVIGRLYISYYYTVAELHIFLSESDLRRLTSRLRVAYASRLTMTTI